MNFKKLVIVLPVALMLLLHFSLRAAYIKHDFAVQMDTPHKLIAASDYNSPHSGKIQTSIEVPSQITEPQHEFKKNQYASLASAFHSNFNAFRGRALKQYNSVALLIPFYISYCTIVV